MVSRREIPSTVFWTNVEKQLNLRGENWAWLRSRIGGKPASSMSNMRKTWPRFDDAMRIAEALGVSADTLYYGREEQERLLRMSRAMVMAIRTISGNVRQNEFVGRLIDSLQREKAPKKSYAGRERRRKSPPC